MFMYMYKYMVTLVSLGFDQLFHTTFCLDFSFPLSWFILNFYSLAFLSPGTSFSTYLFDTFLSGQVSRGHVFFLTFYVWRSLLHGIPCIDNLESWHSLLKFCFLGPLCFDVSLIYRHVFLWEGRLRSCWFVFSTFRNSYTHPKNKTFAHTLYLDPYTSAITMTYT